MSVERGSVQVRQPPDRVLATLEAGQLWGSDASDVASPAPPSRPETPAAPASESAAERAASKPAPAGPSSSKPAAPAVRRNRSPQAVPSASELLGTASEARLGGNTRAAADALEQLLRRYPSDPRAGYAAFMLGRLRLDALGDAAGAADAFSFAVAHPDASFFQEDAEARLVEALAKAGRARECAQARDRFLAKFPRAARAARVAEQCGPN